MSKRSNDGMNLLLLEPGELCEGSALIGGSRARHLREVLRLAPGDLCRAGVIDGPVGEARLLAWVGESAHLHWQPRGGPPAPLDVTVVVALPRPKALRRLLTNLTSLGVKDIYLVHAYRVEKAYWQTDLLNDDQLRAACRAGLEQARDTVLPRVRLERRFKPFAQDVLPKLLQDRDGWVAHPGGEFKPTDAKGPALVMIGPEGGFIPFELECLRAAGLKTIDLGERILKTETALTWLLGAISSRPVRPTDHAR